MLVLLSHRLADIFRPLGFWGLGFRVYGGSNDDPEGPVYNHHVPSNPCSCDCYVAFRGVYSKVEAVCP